MSHARNVFGSMGSEILAIVGIGKILSVNIAFTQLSDYQKKKFMEYPNVLISGGQPQNFNTSMGTVKEGFWQGKMWIKKRL